MYSIYCICIPKQLSPKDTPPYMYTLLQHYSLTFTEIACLLDRRQTVLLRYLSDGLEDVLFVGVVEEEQLRVLPLLLL